ncbi:MAG TPA: PKD domain-containing protein, partial [Bacteroidia bacterium]|nr:PKD domain-containing protein [Bacteroidia bacterium]
MLFFQKSFWIGCVAAVSCIQLPAQENNSNWLEVWENPASDFFTIQRTFDSAWHNTENQMRQSRGAALENEGEESESEEKDGSFRLFKRWEWFYAPRVGAAGDMTLPAYSNINFFSYLDQNETAKQMYNASVNRQASATNWTFVGPTGAPDNGGAGRINFIRFDPSNANIMYAGAPAGGLWKTVDGGASWTCLTDFMPIIGCSDLAIDPVDPNILYLGTGDQDGGDTPSMGVMKSIDGGLTWNSTGLSFSIILSRKIARIIIDPTNSNIIYCGTSAGIYKTYNAGVTWSQVSLSGIKDMEMKPGDPNTLYACRTTFLMSTNGGASWQTVPTGLPQANQVSRMAIAVTPHDPNYVYVVAGNAATNGFEGVYRSTNGGQSFSVRSSSPNLLGWDENGGDSDGQAWYTLSIAVAPYDKDVVVVGGVNVWRSDDGGDNWMLNAHWYGGGGAPYVHADIHGLEFLPGVMGTYFIAHDGGVDVTTNDGASFTDISANMCIAQIYKFGISTTNAGNLITGHQDNGTNVKTGSVYEETLGGDGMDCFIDRTNDNTMFGSIYYGDFYKSTDGGQNWNGITNGLSGNAGWVTPWKQDPVLGNVIYCGYDQVFKSTNLGNSWTQMGTLANSGSLTEIEIAPTNTQYIYTTNASSIYMTPDAGNTWINITNGLATNGTGISGITISPYDERTVWIIMSGYTNNSKVYYSTDAGATWVNISYGLPNIPANAIKAVPGTGNNLVFVGMDAGVYYRSDNSNGWQPYFAALPLAPVSDFEIFELTMTLRAATYGRGVWECPIDAALLTPAAAFTSTSTLICPGQTVQFTDASTNSPVTWSWLFAGGNPSTSSAQNPLVSYALPGTYPVTLTVSNANGSDIETQTTYITVSGSVLPPLVEGFTATTFLPAGWRAVNNATQSVYWQRSSTVGHNSSQSAYFNNLNNNTNGATDDMVTPGINLTGYGSPQMQFDVAYARYSASRSDSLEVLVSDDCGVTWTSVYLKGGTTLSTVPDQTTTFTPTNSQWRTETVNLSAYANVSSLTIAIRNHGRHGNYIYLDNINISATATTAPNALYNMSTACAMDSVQFTDLSSPAPTAWSWTFAGGNPAMSTVQNPSVLW